jgi:secondary thiamine-phosphate synthase enzyme
VPYLERTPFAGFDSRWRTAYVRSTDVHLSLVGRKAAVVADAAWSIVRRADREDERMETATFEVETGSREVVLDITRRCATWAERCGGDGLLHLFVPHATAGLAILETGAGSDDDLLAALRELLPADDRWRHAHGSPGHGRSHVMPALVPPYCTVPVVGGKLQLGTWQAICLVDLNVDNPDRTVRVSLLRG